MKWHKSKSLLFSIILMGITCFFAGCILTTKEYKKVNSYDLGQAGNLEMSQVFVQIEPFMNDSACTGKMLYRINNNKVEVDDYNRWIQSPAVMVTSYLIEAFKPRKTPVDNRPHFAVTGKIVRFEIDLLEKKVQFMVDYQVLDGQTNLLLLQNSKSFINSFSKKEPGAFANAMSGAVEAFASHLQMDLIKLAKKR